MKSKIPQHNTSKPKGKKSDAPKYITQADADMLYMHEGGINNLIEEMYNTIRDDESIDSILAFLIHKGLPRGSYYRWKAQYPQLEQAHDMFNSLIAHRLFRRVNHDVKTIHTVMPNYDPHVWKNMVEYHNNLKKDLAVSAAANAKIVADEWSKIMEEGNDK